MSLPATQNITHYRGDTFRIRFRLKDGAGVAINLDTVAVTYLAQLRDEVNAVAETFAVTEVAPQSGDTLGVVEMSLTAAETKALAPGAYDWDLECTFTASGDVQTPIGGTFVLSVDRSFT